MLQWTPLASAAVIHYLMDGAHSVSTTNFHALLFKQQKRGSSVSKKANLAVLHFDFALKSLEHVLGRGTLVSKATERLLVIRGKDTLTAGAGIIFGVQRVHAISIIPVAWRIHQAAPSSSLRIQETTASASSRWERRW
jgi:hypothetical protein